MASKQSTVDYIVDQTLSVEGISTRKMFGEYALYVGNKVVALICDDTLFVKITEAGKEFVGDLYKEGPAYPGAKPSIVINPDQIDDREWISELISITAEHAPAVKKKAKKKK